MSAPKIGRAYSDRSVGELTDYKQSIGHELRVHVYALMNAKFIIAPLNGSGGAYFQIREVTVLPFDIDDDTLGRCICDNLLWHHTTIPTPFDGRKSEWPVFKASGLKAVKHFEQSAVWSSVATLNTVLEIETRPLHTLAINLYAGARMSAASLHIEIAAELRNTLKAVSILQGTDLM